MVSNLICTWHKFPSNFQVVYYIHHNVCVRSRLFAPALKTRYEKHHHREKEEDGGKHKRLFVSFGFALHFFFFFAHFWFRIFFYFSSTPNRPREMLASTLVKFTGNTWHRDMRYVYAIQFYVWDDIVRAVQCNTHRITHIYLFFCYYTQFNFLTFSPTWRTELKNKKKEPENKCESSAYIYNDFAFPWFDFRYEWNQVFKKTNTGSDILQHLQRVGLDGKLQGSKFRSVYWRVSGTLWLYAD